ncbi:MAG: hypothetical protein HAW62_00970 [Endozoicomonadaceae bacterium]|nr:hypothetical protein [Endozoicomonadaceae bacterium]
MLIIRITSFYQDIHLIYQHFNTEDRSQIYSLLSKHYSIKHTLKMNPRASNPATISLI